MMIDYPKLIRIEKEIKVLIAHRLIEYEYSNVIVETYYAMDKRVMCRIELFGTRTTIAHRVAKYEAELKEGFYFEAEQKLINQTELKIRRQAS